MSLSMAPLLMHSHDVPAIVRAELEAAYAATSERRDEHLLTAARMLSWIVPLDCEDAMELVGLPVTTKRTGGELEQPQCLCSAGTPYGPGVPSDHTGTTTMKVVTGSVVLTPE
jgi:hypothetical protein